MQPSPNPYPVSPSFPNTKLNLPLVFMSPFWAFFSMANDPSRKQMICARQYAENRHRNPASLVVLAQTHSTFCRAENKKNHIKTSLVFLKLDDTLEWHDPARIRDKTSTSCRRYKLAGTLAFLGWSAVSAQKHLVCHLTPRRQRQCLPLRPSPSRPSNNNIYCIKVNHRDEHPPSQKHVTSQAPPPPGLDLPTAADRQVR
jgi:hypothetical protein